ncbi:hypothetical protein L484_022137 [Morus notabilis]|uniref:Uncharacterized protein n=1 Tax=Morus notabilis TaxID=981085 RepID=W9QDT7_9ROSA|nr:hypothetical protein L484_022137 [Morus notabilis]
MSIYLVNASLTKEQIVFDLLEMERRYNLATQGGTDTDEGSSSAASSQEDIVAKVLGQ